MHWARRIAQTKGRSLAVEFCEDPQMLIRHQCPIVRRTKARGGFTLSGANTFTGPTTVAAGANLSANHDLALQSSTVTVVAGPRPMVPPSWSVLPASRFTNDATVIATSRLAAKA